MCYTFRVTRGKDLVRAPASHVRFLHAGGFYGTPPLRDPSNSPKALSPT